LRYLILAMNRVQNYFQFEFVPFDDKDMFLKSLLTNGSIDKPSPSSMLEFHQRERQYFEKVAGEYRLHDQAPEYFQVISVACFSDNYFQIGSGSISVIALGNWKRAMAPPSILEFIQVLVLHGAVYELCPQLHTHLGTRGCLMDFSAELSDARQMVLAGFVCQTCESVLSSQGYSGLVPELRHLLSRRWLGSSADPASPAGIVSKLGYDLFITKGLQPNPLESARMTLAKEGVKQVYTVIGTVIAAVLAAVFLAILGYAAVNVHVTSPSPQPSVTKPAATLTQPISATRSNPDLSGALGLSPELPVSDQVLPGHLRTLLGMRLKGLVVGQSSCQHQ
jgi:hypothetical protein